MEDEEKFMSKKTSVMMLAAALVLAGLVSSCGGPPATMPHPSLYESPAK